jgi:hypothetical protein
VAVRPAGPGEEPDPFGGPRSVWGSRLARAVHGAVLRGARHDAARRLQGPPTTHAEPGAACRAADLLETALPLPAAAV